MTSDNVRLPRERGLSTRRRARASKWLPTEERVAVVIVNYRTPELATACLRSLKPEKAAIPQLQVVVADGASLDGSAERLAHAVTEPEFRGWVSFLPLPVNGGFGWANNQVISSLLAQASPPEYIHLLNPDCEIESGAVIALLRYLSEHPQTSAVGSQLLEPDGSITGSAFSFPSIRGEFSRGARTGFVDRLLKVPPVSICATASCEVDWATGASVMFRRTALEAVGFFDEGFFLYHEEIELMWRLRRAGWTIAFEPRSRVRHVGGASTGVHSRKTRGRVEPRKPSYWYRSRARFFGRTRGKRVAILAYFAWLAGYSLWAMRRALQLAPGAKPFSHEVRDHCRYALPRRSDGIAAVPASTDPPAASPAWMERGWL